MKHIQKVTQKAIVEKDGKVLFLKDPKGLWELPGGTLEFDEEPEKSLARELKEELQAETKGRYKIFDVARFKVERPDWEKTYRYLCLIYIVELKSHDFQLSDEHTELKWLDKDEIKAINTRLCYRKTAIKFLQENIR